jgi:hypothetical protein
VEASFKDELDEETDKNRAFTFGQDYEGEGNQS